MQHYNEASRARIAYVSLKDLLLGIFVTKLDGGSMYRYLDEIVR
jgi:hypothetical protein